MSRNPLSRDEWRANVKREAAQREANAIALLQSLDGPASLDEVAAVSHVNRPRVAQLAREMGIDAAQRGLLIRSLRKPPRITHKHAYRADERTTPLSVDEQQRAERAVAMQKNELARGMAQLRAFNNPYIRAVRSKNK